MGFVHIDHVGIVAFTVEQAQEILGDALGLELDQPRSQWPAGAYFAPEQTYNYFFQVGEGETQVEVLVPEPGATSGAARFLERRGPGLHHLCYACVDVHAEAENRPIEIRRIAAHERGEPVAAWRLAHGGQFRADWRGAQSARRRPGPPPG
jgi:catechol 2,3-dioxygenase-like lactoylglutathione lyase family enzyme